MAANSMFEPCFNKWLSTLLSTMREYYQFYLNVVPNDARFGKDVEGHHRKNAMLKRVLGVLVLTYWRAWYHNTWRVQPDDDGCLNYLPLGSFITDTTIACLLREYDCQHIDLRPLLRAAGVRPLPDGIGVMVVNGDGDCDSIVFQVGRDRRDDNPPSTNINIL